MKLSELQDRLRELAEAGVSPDSIVNAIWEDESGDNESGIKSEISSEVYGVTVEDGEIYISAILGE